MQATREVLKKRHGVSLPVDSIKRKRLKTLLFFDSELKKLDALLDENDIDLHGELLKSYSTSLWCYSSGNLSILITISDLIPKDEQEKLSETYYLRFVKNQYNLTGRPIPYNITITIKIGKKEIATLIEDVLNCFRLPLTIGIDFWAVLTSISR